MKQVVIFGQFGNGPEAARNTVLCRTFSKLCTKTFYCTINFGFARPDAKPAVKIVHALVQAPLRWLWLGLRYILLPHHDLVFVPYPAHSDAWLVLILAKLKKTPVVMDAFYGIYDTAVRDRMIFKARSLAARLIWHYENRLLRAADVILVDTTENAAMFAEDFNIAAKRFVPVPVGVDESLWRPQEPVSKDSFEVVFWSTFIPLHGATTVAEAANLLENHSPPIHFLVIGNGQLGPKFKQKLEKLKPANLTWIDRFVPLAQIQQQVAGADCCLGIFGRTDKTQRVIPYKAYQSLASAKPLITARAHASGALFHHGEDALLVNLEDPVDLSKAVAQLAEDREKAVRIGQKGRALYQNLLSNQVIENKIQNVLEELS